MPIPLPRRSCSGSAWLWGGGCFFAQVRSSIPIQQICAVERVDESAFQQPHMMQILTQDNEGQLHTMYIQCKASSCQGGGTVQQGPWQHGHQSADPVLPTAQSSAEDRACQNPHLGAFML